MQYCIDHPEEISKLSKVKAQVSEVKGVMMENIEKVRHYYHHLDYQPGTVELESKLSIYIVLIMFPVLSHPLLFG